jgi:DNA processing protein
MSGNPVAGADGDFTDVVARMALSTAFEPGNEVVGQLVAELGAPAAVEFLASVETRARGLAVLARRWQEDNWVASAEAELELASRRGIEVIVPGVVTWPTQLDDLQERAPLALRVQGALRVRPSLARSVAVVGARAATRYGVWVAEELCAHLAAEGWCVVSGGALGIDAASHRGALAGAGPTIAVSAAGVNIPVPSSNDSLFARLYESGAVISEVPIGKHPNRRRFLVRNRVIAALTPVTVVVEAAMRSGALSTAREADAMGRSLCAFPGPTTSAMSAGCHDLIASGAARLVTSAEDVIDVALGSGERNSDGERFMSIDLQEQQVLDSCADRSASPQQISRICGISIDAAAATLYLLERKGLVRQTARGWRSIDRAQ